MKRLTVGVCAASVVLVLAACGSDDDGSTTAAACPVAPASQKPAALCDVTIDAPPPESTRHVPEGTHVDYCTNPPSSGPHYPVWAAFQEYDHPIDWPYLVHSIEHGAVLLLYKCDAACPDTVTALRALAAALPVDPECEGMGTDRRIIIAPSTTILTPVAATAWGATYQAACLDTATLDAFVRGHYGKGPEDFCVPGKVL